MIALAFFFWRYVEAEPVLPAIVPGEVIHFSTTLLDSGQKVNTGSYEYVMAESNLIRQRGQFTFANGNRAQEESVLLIAGKAYIPRSFSYVVTSPKGLTIREEKMIFSSNAREVRVIRHYSDPTGQEDGGVKDEIDKKVAVPPNTYPRQMFDILLRTLDLAPGSRQKLNCITRLGEVYGMFLQEDGQEKVTTPAGTFDTVRVRLIPDIPLLPTLMPSLTIRLWYSVEKPRVAVKFEGYAQPPPPKFQDEVRVIATKVVRPLD